MRFRPQSRSPGGRSVDAKCQIVGSIGNSQTFRRCQYTLIADGLGNIGLHLWAGSQQ